MLFESLHLVSKYASISAHPLTLLQNFKKFFGKVLSGNSEMLLKMESA